MTIACLQAFKQTIKELERRLSAVVHLAFLDRTTPLAKYKLFEVRTPSLFLREQR